MGGAVANELARTIIKGPTEAPEATEPIMVETKDHPTEKSPIQKDSKDSTKSRRECGRNEGPNWRSNGREPDGEEPTFTIETN